MQKLDLGKLVFRVVHVNPKNVPVYYGNDDDEISDIIQHAMQHVFRHMGTAFGILRPDLVLTANHVVSETDIGSLFVVAEHSGVSEWHIIDRVESHPDADVAALFIREIVPPHSMPPLSYFNIGLPRDVDPDFDDFPLAEEVLAHGFPIVGNEKLINPRMMKGHIQSINKHTSTSMSRHYRYHAYELSFPAFHGLSGAPVLRNLDRQTAIGIVTEQIFHSTEQDDQETKAYPTVAAALHPLADWIKSL